MESWPLKKNKIWRHPNTLSCAYSKSFWDCFFHRTTLVIAFEISFSIRKEKKKVNGEIAFALISLCHIKYKSLQASQLPREHLKFLKQEVDDDLSICVD